MHKMIQPSHFSNLRSQKLYPTNEIILSLVVTSAFDSGGILVIRRHGANLVNFALLVHGRVVTIYHTCLGLLVKITDKWYHSQRETYLSQLSRSQCMLLNDPISMQDCTQSFAGRFVGIFVPSMPTGGLENKNNHLWPFTKFILKRCISNPTSVSTPLEGHRRFKFKRLLFGAKKHDLSYEAVHVLQFRETAGSARVNEM